MKSAGYPLAGRARVWLHEAAPYDRDVVAFLTDAEACRDVDRYYPGGWAAFEANQ